MRIGIFTDAYLPAVSGVVTSVRNLALELRELGHEVYIITIDNGYKSDDDKLIQFRGIPYPFKMLRDYRFNIIGKKHIKEIGELNLDIIHSHTEFSIGRLAHKAASKYNIPYVYTYHTIYEEYMHYLSKAFRNPLKSFARRLTRKICTRPETIVVPTEKVKNLLQTYGVSKAIQIIPTGIDLDRFKRCSFSGEDVGKLKTKYGIKEDELVLLFIGRVAKEKSINVLIAQFKIALEKYPHLRLVIVGDGPDLNDLKSQAKQLGLLDKIVFTGLIPNEEVPVYYCLGDIFVNASITETQGLTYVEALASRLPLLVKYDVNLSNVIKDGVNGMFFYKNEEFVDKLTHMIEDDALFAQMVENTEETASEFSKQTYAKRCIALYEKFVKE